MVIFPPCFLLFYTLCIFFPSWISSDTYSLVWTLTKFEIDFHFLVKCLYKQYQLYMYTHSFKVRARVETEIFLISFFKGHNSVKNWTWTKFKLDLYFLINICIYNFNLIYTVYIPSKVREQKLKFSYFF